jgi:hypothetical protein
VIVVECIVPLVPNSNLVSKSVIEMDVIILSQSPLMREKKNNLRIWLKEQDFKDFKLHLVLPTFMSWKFLRMLNLLSYS